MQIARAYSKKIQGFTLVELLVTLAVVAVVMTMGLPEMANYLRNNRMSVQANHFIAVMNFARAQAISRNQEIFVTSLAKNNNNYWEQGWQVWVDGHAGCASTAPNGKQEACEVLRDFSLDSAKLKGPTNLSAISYAKLTDDTIKSRTFSFNGGNGSLNITNDMSFYVCNAESKYEGREIVLRPTGRLRVENAHLKPCPPAS
jgi:prepilin-type N-terminal cleavage/methylation domain-containing protein